jgi:hypothetical protein
MIKDIRFSYASFNLIFIIIFVSGWLFPKFSILGINVGIQEIVAIFLLLFKYSIDKKIFWFFLADLFFSLVFVFLGFFYLTDNDTEGFLISLRTLLFVLTSLSITNLSLEQLEKILLYIIKIYALFFIIVIGRILLNIISNPFDVINFFYGSDSYRVRSPFEPEGTASSQVPIGYLLALISCLPIVLNSKIFKYIFIIGAIGTTSRASIISIVLVYLRKVNFKKTSFIFALAFLGILLYLVFLKSFMSNDGELDGSSIKRLELYSNSIKVIFDNPKSFFLGFGLSQKLLLENTGENFYESFLVNSLMQGGFILFLASIWIILKTLYIDFKYKIYSIGFVVLIGNLIGGSNYFSMYAYPLMVIIITIAIKKHKKSNEKNFALDNI